MSWLLGLMWLVLGWIFLASNGWEESVPAWFSFGAANFFFGVSIIAEAIKKAGKK